MNVKVTYDFQRVQEWIVDWGETTAAGRLRDAIEREIVFRAAPDCPPFETSREPVSGNWQEPLDIPPRPK